MTDSVEIRESGPDDLAGIEALYPDAFPDEDLLPLVQDLLQHEAAISLVGLSSAALVAHVVFTACGLSESEDKVALLGPLAVASSHQRQGIGSAIVRAGLERLEAERFTRIFVLGDPAYYGRLGFQPDDQVAPPYLLPDAWQGAWRSIGFRGAAPPPPGRLIVPEPWRQRALWAP